MNFTWLPYKVAVVHVAQPIPDLFSTAPLLRIFRVCCIDSSVVYFSFTAETDLQCNLIFVLYGGLSSI